MAESSDILPPAAKDTRRLYFLDNLRIALIILVIADHVGLTIREVTRAPILGSFFTVNRAFLMSLFFMISGCLMVMSYDRSRPWAFGMPAIWERCLSASTTAMRISDTAHGWPDGMATGRR